MLTLTTTVEAAVGFQPNPSLLELIILWYLFFLLNANASRLAKRWIIREKRRKRRPLRRSGFQAICR